MRSTAHSVQAADISDSLKQAPDQLESLIGDKKYLQAATLLVSSLKTINKPEMVSIGATAELRAYLTSQETVSVSVTPCSFQTVTDILVEELHSLLYLKTFDSDSRWKPYMNGETSSKSWQPPSQLRSASLSLYLLSLSTPSEAQLDPSGESYRLMETLLESLAVLGKLSTALDVVAQRVSSEIHTLIEITLDEVEDR